MEKVYFIAILKELRLQWYPERTNLHRMQDKMKVAYQNNAMDYIIDKFEMAPDNVDPIELLNEIREMFKTGFTESSDNKNKYIFSVSVNVVNDMIDVFSAAFN